MAGYSGTPLPTKLGIKPDHRIALLGAPPDFRRVLGDLPPGTAVIEAAGTAAPKGAFDVILLFVTAASHLTKQFARVAGHLEQNGGLWVAWPKRASGVPTDVTENTVRDVALAAGLVDNKVCAIDDTWSGLRCVIRLKDRRR